MNRTECVQDSITVETQCGNCGNIVPLIYAKSRKRWEGMCSECKLNLFVEIKTKPLRFKSSDTSNIKECDLCGKKWMTSHTCDAPDIPTIVKELISKGNTSKQQSESKVDSQ